MAEKFTGAALTGMLLVYVRDEVLDFVYEGQRFVPFCTPADVVMTVAALLPEGAMVRLRQVNDGPGALAALRAVGVRVAVNVRPGPDDRVSWTSPCDEGPLIQHDTCRAPARCACECLGCKRAWWAADRPGGAKLSHDEAEAELDAAAEAVLTGNRK